MKHLLLVLLLIVILCYNYSCVFESYRDPYQYTIPNIEDDDDGDDEPRGWSNHHNFSKNNWHKRHHRRHRGRPGGRNRGRPDIIPGRPAEKPDKRPDRQPGVNIPTIYRNFPKGGTTLPQFYEKCVKCANQNKAFKYIPSAKKVNFKNKLSTNVDGTSISYKCELFPSKYSIANLTKVCQLPISQNYNCSVNKKEDCNIIVSNNQFCRYDTKSKKCLNIQKNECNPNTFKEFTKKLALSTCKMSRDNADDFNDITGRYGCDNDTPPQSKTICPSNSPF